MKINLIYSEDCPHCEELLEKIEKQGGLPDMELNLVKLESVEGIELAAEVGIEEIPVAMTTDKLTCEIRYLNDKVEVICPDQGENVNAGTDETT